MQTSEQTQLFTQKTVPAQAVLQFTTRTTLPQLGQYALTVFERLQAEAARLGLTVSGPIQWIYTGADGKPETEFRLDIALPVVNFNGQTSDEFTLAELPAFDCVTTEYVGGWDGIPAVYDALMAHVQASGLTVTDVCREVYPTPHETDPTKHVTEIQVGVL